jgi:pimeloyl-ACP methyl ester carboxylesterase
MRAFRWFALAAVLLASLPKRGLYGQEDSLRRATATRELVGLGDLKFVGAMHGPAPMVVLLTEAPATAPTFARQYQHEISLALVAQIRARGFSWFSFVQSAGSVSREQSDTGLRTFEAAAEHSLALIREAAGPSGSPRAIVGFGEGAVVAARLALRSPESLVLVALAPSVRMPGGKSWHRQPRWDDLLLARDRPRISLVVQSPCNGPVPQALLDRSGYMSPVVIFANLDGWLSPTYRSQCAPAFDPSGRAAGMTIAPFVAEWLVPHLPFFE